MSFKLPETRLRHIILQTLVFLLLASHLFGDEAVVVREISPMGVQIGGKTKITVVGSGLGATSRLTLPKDVEQTLIESTGDRAVFEVQVPKLAREEIVWAAVTDQQGNSSETLPLAFDFLPQSAWTTNVDSLPIAVTGSIAGNEVKSIKVALKKDRPVTVDLQTRRLGTSLQPFLRVLDPTGKQVASSSPLLRLSGDAQTVFVPSVDGVYEIQVRDLIFQAPTPGYFRLRVGEFKSLDNLPYAAWQKPSEPLAENPLLTALRVWPVLANPTLINEQRTISGSAKVLESGWPTVPAASLSRRDFGSFGQLPLAPRPPVVVTSPFDGSFPYRFAVDVAAGQPIEVDLYSGRLGSDADLRLRLLAPDGRELASADDRRDSLDATLRWPGQADISSAIVEIVLVAKSQSAAIPIAVAVNQSPVPNVELFSESKSLKTQAGGIAVTTIRVQREGFDGPIKLYAIDVGASNDSNHPKLVGEGTMEPGNDRGLITINTPVDGLAQQTNRWIQIVGSWGDEKQPRVTVAKIDGRPSLQQLADEYVIELSQKPAPMFAASWKVDSNQELEVAAGLPADLPINVQIAPGVELGSTLGFRANLISNQIVPRQNPADPNSPRDENRAVKVTNTPENATAENRFGLLRWTIPTNPGDELFEASIRIDVVELASQRVIASASLPPKTIRIVSPVSIAWEGETPSELKFVKGGEIPKSARLRISRRTEVTGPVEIKFVGLTDAANPIAAKLELPELTTTVDLPWPDVSMQAAGAVLEQLEIQASWVVPSQPQAPPVLSNKLKLPKILIVNP